MSDTEAAKKKVTEILQKVTSRDEKYLFDDRFIRWGFVERDLHAVIDKLVIEATR